MRKQIITVERWFFNEDILPIWTTRSKLISASEWQVPFVTEQRPRESRLVNRQVETYHVLLVNVCAMVEERSHDILMAFFAGHEQGAPLVLEAMRRGEITNKFACR